MFFESYNTDNEQITCLHSNLISEPKKICNFYTKQ